MNIKENAEALHRPRDAFCARGLVLRRYVAGRPQGSDVRPTEGPCEHDSWLMIVEHLARYPLRMLHDHGRLCAPPVGWLLFRVAGEVDRMPQRSATKTASVAYQPGRPWPAERYGDLAPASA